MLLSHGQIRQRQTLQNINDDKKLKTLTVTEITTSMPLYQESSSLDAADCQFTGDIINNDNAVYMCLSDSTWKLLGGKSTIAVDGPSIAVSSPYSADDYTDGGLPVLMKTVQK